MKLMDLCLNGNLNMVLYDCRFGVEFARIDGKNGVCENILDCNVGYMSIRDNWLHIETDFSVYSFIDNNWRKLNNLIIDDYIKFSMLVSSNGIFSAGKTKVIRRLTTPYGENMYSVDKQDIYGVDNIVYTDSEFKQYIMSDDEYLLHITKNWNSYELEWDLL